VEIISADTDNPATANTSEGLAVLHLFSKITGLPVFDPTLLTALQRAFACAVNDSLMFMQHNAPYNVKPAPSLVVAGIEFINDETLPF